MRDHSSRLILYEKPAPPPGSSCMRQDCLLLIVDSRGIIVDSRGIDNMPKPSDLLQGTLDLLILRTIARGEHYVRVVVASALSNTIESTRPEYHAGKGRSSVDAAGKAV